MPTLTRGRFFCMALTQEKLAKIEKLASYKSTAGRLLFISDQIDQVDEKTQANIAELKEFLIQKQVEIDQEIQETAKKVVRGPLFRGPKGEKGDKGDKGEKGDQGPRGEVGPRAEITQEILDDLALSVESQIPPMLDHHFFNVKIDASQVLNLEENINITKVDLSKLELDASQIKNLPESKVIERGGGSSGVERIKSGNRTIRQGATEIVFGDNLVVTRTPNGVRIDGAPSGLSASAILSATGDVDDSNTDFIFTEKPTLVVVNGANYRENHGWTWDSGTLTASIAFPAGTNGDVYGIK